MVAYGMTTTIRAPRAAVRARVEAALKDEGFGILTRIDMQGTLKERIGVDIEPYEILGACNPGLARRALEVDRSLGLLLPCNAVVYEQDGRTVVGLINAEKMLEVTGRDELKPFAAEVNERLQRALASV